VGIHARPAGLLVKKASEFKSEILLECNGKEADAKKIFSVMGLGAKCGDSVTVKASGQDEDAAVKEVQKLFEESL
jgi:phosphocarrier protein